MTSREIIVVVVVAILGLGLILALIAIYDKLGRTIVWAGIIVLTALSALIFKSARNDIILGGVMLCYIVWRINFNDRIQDRLYRRKRRNN